MLVGNLSHIRNHYKALCDSLAVADLPASSWDQLDHAVGLSQYDALLVIFDNDDVLHIDRWIKRDSAPLIFVTRDGESINPDQFIEYGAANYIPIEHLSPINLNIALRGARLLSSAKSEHLRTVQDASFYASIVASTDDAIIGKTLDGTILSWNPGAERLYGYSAEEVIGRNISVLVPAELTDELQEILRRLRSGQRVEHFETSRITKHGTVLNVVLTISLIRDVDGTLVGASTIARDITARKAAECVLRIKAEREFLISQISRAVIYNDSPSELASQALALLGERMKVDRCFYVLYDVDSNRAIVERDWCSSGVPSLEGEWDLADQGFSINDIYEGGRTQIVSDVETDPVHPTVVDLFVKTGQRSYIAVPFFENGRPVAALTVMMATPRNWTIDEVELVEAAAVQVRGEVESARSRQRERESQARIKHFLRDVLASVTEGRLILCENASELPEPYAPVANAVRLTKIGGLKELRAATRTACESIGMAEDRTFDVVTAASEAGMNAIVHVGEGTGFVSADAQNGVVQISIIDHGTGISFSDIPHATLRKGYTTAGTLGHGMKMILQMTDRTYLLTGVTGTTVVIEQNRIASESTTNNARFPVVDFGLVA